MFIKKIDYKFINKLFKNYEKACKNGHWAIVLDLSRSPFLKIGTILAIVQSGKKLLKQCFMNT